MVNACEVTFSEKALKALQRIDKYQAQLVMAWINKNLVNCVNPRAQGKALVGDKKGYWRYRVGSYRIIAGINDSEITIVLVNIAHRSQVYQD